MSPELHELMLTHMSRLESVEAFRSLDPDEWPRLAVEACQLAITAAAVDDHHALTALHALQLNQAGADIAASTRELADQFDEDAWTAQEAGDEQKYDLLFRSSRAVSALAYALSGKPDEAIYEAAYAVGTPEDLVARLMS
jgi:hypothetical protein